METKIRNYILNHKDEILNDLISLVKVEGSTDEIENLVEVRNQLKEIINKRFNRIIEEIQVESTRNCLYTKLIDQDNDKSILLLGHYDTVHPRGTMPLNIYNNIFYGPGVCDMKGGIIIGLWACKAINELRYKTNYPVYMLNNGDEEKGSRDSLNILLDKAKNTRAVLILEPAFDNGDLKTGRKGAGGCKITIYGKASHAGLHPEEGVSAIEEAAHHILALHSLNNNEFGTTINVGVIHGGTVKNVIADKVILDIDIRVKTLSEIERIERAIKDIPLILKGTRKEVEFLKPTLPLEEKEENIQLFELYKEGANRIGIEVGKSFVGGASDANRLVCLNIPILDGLGAVGKGMHANHEQIDLNQFFDRIVMLACLLMNTK